MIYRVLTSPMFRSGEIDPTRVGNFRNRRTDILSVFFLRFGQTSRSRIDCLNLPECASQRAWPWILLRLLHWRQSYAVGTGEPCPSTQLPTRYFLPGRPPSEPRTTRTGLLMSRMELPELSMATNSPFATFALQLAH